MTNTNISVAPGDIVTVTGAQPPTIPPATTNYIFQDDFNGDLSKWVVMDGTTLNQITQKASNVFIDKAASHLVVRTKRESSGFSGGGLATFEYGKGWPAVGSKLFLPLPFRIDIKALMPHTPGAWCGPWLMTVDRPNTEDIYELDVAEARMTLPTTSASHQHTWKNGVGSAAWDAHMSIADMGKNWHVYRADVRSDRVDYFVDDVLLIGTSYGVAGSYGVIIDNGIAPASSWGAAGGQPSPTDQGPWDALFEYVHAWAL